MELISWSDFEKVHICAGTILSVDEFPEARKPAYIVRVDFGKEIGIKKTSAQITDAYDVDELVGKQILGVVNFPSKQIGPIKSEFLLTGCTNVSGAVIISTLERAVPNGSRLH